MTKYCKKCCTEKDTAAFGKDKHAKDGIQAYCKECRNAHYHNKMTDPARRADYNKRHREYRATIKKRHSLSDKEELLADIRQSIAELQEKSNNIAEQQQELQATINKLKKLIGECQ